MDKDNAILPVYKLAMEEVATANLKASAQRLELEYDEGVHLDFLSRSYVVTNKGVFKENREHASQIISALLIQYCLSDTQSRPTGNFVSMSQLAGPGSGIGSYFANEFMTNMDRKFSNNIEKLERVVAEFSGEKADVLISGGVSFIFEPLKHIPLNLVFYPADDEFGAGGSILLDETATDFLGFETLAFLVTIFLRKLVEKDC